MYRYKVWKNQHVVDNNCVCNTGFTNKGCTATFVRNDIPTKRHGNLLFADIEGRSERSHKLGYKYYATEIKKDGGYYCWPFNDIDVKMQTSPSVSIWKTGL